MAKRVREQDENTGSPKRLKADSHHQTGVIAEIQFAHQLEQLLTFRQDGIQSLLSGIASFKAFLESILYHRDEDIRPRQLSILHEYLDTQKLALEKDPDRPLLSQLWQAWSFASQNNSDRLISSVTSILTLLLKTLSSLLDFRDHGILLCRAILQHRHLRLVKRSLDAPKHKDFVISPCLRLLIEVVSFDGGVVAREVYKGREQTFDPACLKQNLGIVKTDISEEESRRRPSIRTLTVRYILLNLKHQQASAKIDILKNRPLCRSLFHFLQDDPAELVIELLNVTEQSVCKDIELPRSAKATLLTQHNLERVTEIASRNGENHLLQQRAFEWLQAVCTKPAYGILRASGWYPPGTATVDLGNEDTNGAIDLGLDSLEFYDREARPDVRNTTMLGWIETLRPHADAQQRQLLITCFKSAPELVAAYFAEKTIQLEPTQSNTWIGYVSFLFEVIRLNIPGHLGNVDAEEIAQLPPQVNIMSESVLPRPFTQKILTRCLNQSSELITFCALRLLVLAFQKLAEMQRQFERAFLAANENAALWREAFERLSSRIIGRAPSMRDLINTSRKIPDDREHVLQREAVFRLMRLYFEVTPLHAMEEQFDISVPLTAGLARWGSEDGKDEIQQIRALEVEHLLYISKHSPGMRWFNKQRGLAFSTITTLLKLCSQGLDSRPVRELVVQVLSENDLLGNEAEVEALIASLVESSESESAVWTFLDDCLARVNRQPIKYVDYLDAVEPGTDVRHLGTAGSAFSRLCLLPAVVSEQTGFVMKETEILAWIGRFLDLLTRVKSSAIVEVLRQRFFEMTEFQQRPSDEEAEALLQKVHSVAPQVATSQAPADSIEIVPTLPFGLPLGEHDDHPELIRWSQKDLELAIEHKDIDALMLCLCSQHSDVRRQANSLLLKLRAQLESSSLDAKDQIGVLVGELVETYEQQCLPEGTALPFLAGAFATHSLHVLLDPTHYLYPKLNRYMMRSSEWRISRLPSYWLSNTVLSTPDEDDAYWKEIQWVLNWLVDGLRTFADVEILRRGGVFEKMMSLYNSPAADDKLVKVKVLELLFAATCVDGGSDTLITRCGVLVWLDLMKMSGKDVPALLRKRVLEVCDQERIERWSGKSIKHM